MFFGEYEHNIDDKGRVIMPAKFREELGMVFYVTKGLNSCLFVYPKEAWEKRIEELGRLGDNQEQVRRFKRIFFSNASQNILDKQGRVVIAPKLRQQANLTKEIVFIGVNDHIEIWDAKNWEEYINMDDETYETLASYLDNPQL